MALVAAGAGDELARAYARCERIAREHYENFPVASRLLPAGMRPHVAAIYAFARAADDFADEPGLPDVERFRLLDVWHRYLVQGVNSPNGDSHLFQDVDAGVNLRNGDSHLFQTVDTGVNSENGACPRFAEDVFRALHHTIRSCRLPLSLFEDLLSAFRQDITTTRYATWPGLLDYCRRSANPVGRLVLRVAGYDDPRLDLSSDALCTALQLTNFWQDLARDWSNGRLYVPLDERDRAGARDEDLDGRRMTPEWQTALSAAAARTRGLFAAGRAVCDAVHGRLAWELRLTWLGGSRILDGLERARFDVFRARPALGPSDVPVLAWRAVRWKRTP